MSSPRLADYVERLIPADYKSSNPSDRPFNNGTARDPPLLRPRGVNHILLYPGSFNPPHQGHLNLLKHTFMNAGADLNLVAAIIVPCSDESVKGKMERRGSDMVFPKEKRIKLWCGNGIPVDWAWVYDGSEDWRAFRTRLTNAVRNDAMELTFMVLQGPDIINTERGYCPSGWDCSDAVTTDISRAVDFRYPSTLRQIGGCTPWKKLNVDRYSIEQRIRAKLKGSPESVIDEAVTKAMENLDAIWVCMQVYDKPHGIVRFLKSDLSKHTADAPSSTKIRAIIDSSPPEELEKNLQGIALHPDLLVKYLKELPKLVNCAEPAKTVKPVGPLEVCEWGCSLDSPIDWSDDEKTTPESDW
ncbi:hypothetical protein SNK05_003830 [Fusarium graminearum]